jgi:hypothetical protein
MRRLLLGLTGLTTALLLAGTAPALATAPAVTAGITVGGSVSSPGTLSAADLAALPQVSLPLHTVTGGTRGSVSGALLTDALATKGPVFDSGKNGLLRAKVTVKGRGGATAVFAYGELDPGFGNHPAVLTESAGHVGLVVPGDLLRLRSVADVSSVVVTDLAAPVSTPPAGGVTVRAGGRTVVLPAKTLAALPREKRTVTYSAGPVSQTHTESGPTLTAVLLAARVLPLPGVVVTAVGTDGYGAAVTNAEALIGRRPLLLSLAEDGTALAQPRLVTAGDVKGGRYVSDVVTLAVG